MKKIEIEEKVEKNKIPSCLSFVFDQNLFITIFL